MIRIWGKGMHYISKSPHNDSSMWGCEKETKGERVYIQYVAVWLEIFSQAVGSDHLCGVLLLLHDQHLRPLNIIIKFQGKALGLRTRHD